MRNLKKILALVLALVMSMSLLATANAFTDDAKIDGSYEEATKVLAALKVFEGYEDGSFNPTGLITREEVAAVIYRLASTDVKNTQKGLYVEACKFDDVESTRWSAGYIGYAANGGYIKGYGDGKFGPTDNVTGYQVLAMILRVIGYGKNGEFTGDKWQENVASTAQQLKLLTNVKGTVLLSAPATRELVAELIFRAINISMVTYTPAMAYAKTGTTLGYQNFRLYQYGEVYGTYGRPAMRWSANGAKLVDVAYKAKATYTTPVAECQIAADLALTASATVSQAWIDGQNISAITKLTGRNNTIDLYHGIDNNYGSNIVGCQGRQTEIYKLADGTYSIVEINTYFGTVASVTAAKVDALGHTTKRSITVNVYTSADSVQKTFETEAFAAKDTVLVTLNGNAIASVEAVAPVATGKVTAFSGRQCNDETSIKDSQSKIVGTVTVGGNTYLDADKFFVGYPTVANSTLYNIYTDKGGNVIALVPVGVTTTYAVINAIRWNSPNMGTTVGGYVTANLTLADGSVVNDVIVAKINGKAPISIDSSFGTVYPAGTASTVSNVYTMNPAYYDHLITYVVNADGNYELTVAPSCENETEMSLDMDTVTITKGKSTIYGKKTTSAAEQINTAYASDKTVFLYNNGKYGYDVYVGYNNAPSITDADMCYLVDGGIVTLAVVKGTLTENSNFSAYLASATPAYIKNIEGKLYNIYNVYKIGSTEATEVAVLTTAAQPAKAGFYTVAIKDGAATLTYYQYENYLAKDLTFAGKKLDIVYANTKVIENSIATSLDKAATNPVKNFSNMINAEYFLVKNGTITTGAYTDVAADKIIQVLYTATEVTVGELKQTIYTPAYVYLADFTTLPTEKDEDVPASVKADVEEALAAVTDAWAAAGDSVSVKSAIADVVAVALNSAYDFTIDMGAQFDAISAGSINTITVTVTVKDGSTVITNYALTVRVNVAAAALS